MLLLPVAPELRLARLDGDILQKVCIPLGLGALEPQLVEEGHHLAQHTSLRRFLLMRRVRQGAY